MNQIKATSLLAQQQTRTVGKMLSIKPQSSPLKISVPKVSIKLTFKVTFEKVG